MQIAGLFFHKGRIALLQESKRGRSVVPAVLPIKAENDGRFLQKGDGAACRINVSRIKLKSN
jgi:hypothetical protein